MPGHGHIVVQADPFRRLTGAFGRELAGAVAARFIEGLMARVGPAVAMMRVADLDYELVPTASGEEELDILIGELRGGAHIVEWGGERYFLDTRTGVASPRYLSRDLRNGVGKWCAECAFTAAIERRTPLEVCDDEMLATVDRLRTTVLRLSRAKVADFAPHYQPIVHLPSHEVAGYESLMRWDDGKEAGPSEFLPILEGTALLGPISTSTIATAVAELPRGITMAAGADSFVSINVSQRQLLNPAIVDSTIEQVGNSGADPARFWIELREDEVIRIASEAAHAVDALSEAGCTIVVDDLGSGYSALSYLRDLPVDVLKVDGDLVNSLDSDSAEESETTVAVVRAICDVARATGSKTVAEGVEDAAVVPLLVDLGFDYAQGYHFGRPASSAALFG
ncbi:MAG TPA: EAL domain-containing protein [Gordonia polyisoprenivorans]|uniref:EAL domain-containing protein n=1 Tax=Gordonia polyisoprenivorans TaxID=84595 RepID=UPI0003803B05|nr:EAL domain-containing protein [Gordonia polyisoprenivorans]OZC29172.1 EAL domain-containing protein [Gordonia polyisoprenivorans]QUD81668.1 EAL domain-containing protein [Gordonia polyisoprenivorans]UZF57569.1 EAL domain-containing protein [Gordonia polyisoprenivorans]HCS59740.1 EAL domain-containing protein [Gordonia polyisoprenivorans]